MPCQTLTLNKMETEEKQIAKLWKKLKIEQLHFNFSCGGDSMNDTNIEMYRAKMKHIDKDKLSDEEKEMYDTIHDYFDSEVYKEVDFYVNSDGHYIGEQGVVLIELNDDDMFSYSKDAESEWSERVTEKLGLKLTDEEIAFVKEFVSNINGSQGDFNINYKKDFLMTDRYEELVSEINEKIEDCASDFTPDFDGEATDYFEYTTDNDGGNSNDDIEIIGNEMSLYVSKEFYVFKPSED